MAHLAILALPAAALAGLVAVASVPVVRAAPPGERVELELAGVLPMPEGSASILVLREKGARTLLPLFVPGVPEAEGAGPPHAAGLLGDAIEALGGKVAEVQIDRAEETRSGSRVRLAQGGRRLEVRARPSESVALAVAAGVPILTTRRVLDEMGLTPDDLARAHARARAGDRKL